MATQSPVYTPFGTIEEAAEKWERLDILVNNAGVNIRRPLDELDEADWHTVIDTNLSSAFLCCKAVYPVMKGQGAGKGQG